ncbi:hypothetical protein Taro_053273, partial [Colocasia esculenta]|nr:hypothetical protein [Colocasia esculenta]
QLTRTNYTGLPLSLAATDERSSCRSTRTSQTTVETNQHHNRGPHCHGPMPGTFRDSGLSSLEVRHWKRTSWGPVTSTGVRTPNYERATRDKTTNSHKSLSHCRLSLSRTYNSSTGVRVSRTDDTDLDGTAQVPRQAPSTSLAHTEPGAPN